MDYQKSEQIQQLLCGKDDGRNLTTIGKELVKPYISTWNSTRDSGFECISPIEKMRFPTNGVKTR